MSANGLIPVCRAVYIHCFKINPSTFCCPLFSEIYLNPQDQQNSKQTYCQLLIIKFLWTPKGFISPARVFLEFFPEPVYSTMVAEKLNLNLNLKTESVQLYSCFQANSLTGFHHYPPGRRELPIPYRVEKINKISKGNFCNLYIFVLCFVVQWFSFKHLEV